MKNLSPRWQARLAISSAFVLTTLAWTGGALEESSHETLRARLQGFVEPADPAELVTDVRTMEDRGLASGASADSVWSGDFWPLRYGGITAPYKKGYTVGILGRISTERNLKNFNKKWAKLDPRNLSPGDIADLAPAEKLDILLSDYDLTLSRSVWVQIQEHMARWDKTKRWEGVCHGWSTAAIQAPRPVQRVTLRSRNGRYEIPFHPDDIKGLASWLWGNSLIQDYTKFEGRRCRNRYRSHDPITGMSNDPACNGVEPSMFHLALVNLLGTRQESFIINKNNDLQIWNQPLKSYRTRWFNVNSGRETSPDRAIVPLEKMTSDIRRAQRAKETRHVLGVNAKVWYVKETKPTRDGTDSPGEDTVKNIEYIYDLELDEQMRIVGGQWRNFRTDDESIQDAEENEMEQAEFPGFPGFIWKIQRGSTIAFSSGSAGPDGKDIGEWNVGDAIPEAFVERSKAGASFRYLVWKTDRDGNILYDENGNAVVNYKELRTQPLSSIVHGLLRAAKDPADRRELRY